jgi:glycosyltransferase involved in cell wall biosynthesis
MNDGQRTHLAIVIHGLNDSWLGGLNYYRNLVAVFDHAQDDSLHLHFLTDDPSLLSGLNLSNRVSVHRVPMLQRNTPAWAVRKTLLLALKRDVMLIAHLKKLNVAAAVFCHVPGAMAAGIRCLPWIPDFQFRHHPEMSLPELAEAENKRAESWLRDSNALIVSSQSARDDAVAFYGADPLRVHVLKFAPRIEADALASTALRDEVFSRHGIDRPYFFLPNQYWKHKNHALVAQALCELRKQGSAMPLIVSTGRTEDLRHASYFPEFESFIRAEKLQAHYRILGVIGRQDMMVLLAHARAVINPSLFEGWSTGVEEAKALGKPLLVSDIPVHREQVAGLADARVFATDDVVGLARWLHEWQQSAGGLNDHPPQPRPALYEEFSRQYISLLKRLAAPHAIAA